MWHAPPDVDFRPLSTEAMSEVRADQHFDHSYEHHGPLGHSVAVLDSVPSSIIEQYQPSSDIDLAQDSTLSSSGQPGSSLVQASLVSRSAVPNHGALVDNLTNQDQSPNLIMDSGPSDALHFDRNCSELMEKLEHLHDIMDKHQILIADLTVDEVNRQIEALDLSQLPTGVQEAIKKFQLDDSIKMVKKHANNVRQMIREAQTRDPNWILSNEDQSRQTKSFHRLNNNDGVISFKVEARSIRCNVFNLLALFNEFDLLPAMLSTPLAKLEIEPLHLLKFRKLMHVMVTPIWPFAARDVALDMSGFDVLEQKCVVVCGESFEKAEDLGIAVPDASSKSKRVSAELSGAVLRPIGENLTSMVLIATIDLKLGVIPPALLQFVTKKLTLPVFQIFVRQAEKLPDSKAHQERLDADRFGIYKTIQQALQCFDYEESQLAEIDAYSQAEDPRRTETSLSCHQSQLSAVI